MSIAPISNSNENIYANKAKAKAVSEKSENSNDTSKPVNITDKVELSDYSKSSLQQAEITTALLKAMKNNEKFKEDFNVDDVNLSKELESVQVNLIESEYFKGMSQVNMAFWANSLGYLFDKNADMTNLASAYDTVRKDLNENPENLEKYVGFLDNSFRGMAQAMSVRDAKEINIKGLPESFLIESARKQATIFTNSFLNSYKNYKDAKDETAALSSAMEELNNMPETDSLSNISYKDFQLLSEISKNSNSPDKSEENARLYNNLSDFLKGMFSLDDFVKV